MPPLFVYNLQNVYYNKKYEIYKKQWYFNAPDIFFGYTGYRYAGKSGV